MERSANADWVRALQRTADVAPSSARTLACVIAAVADVSPERPALIGETASLTYGALAACANRYARWAMAQGLRPGDRVALVMGNHPDYAAIWIGLSRVGVVTALVNHQLVGAGLAHCLSVAGARHVIVDGERLDAVSAIAEAAVQIWVQGADAPGRTRLDRVVADLSPLPLSEGEAPDVRLRDQALLIYTSGTTGLPKAARVSHYRIMMWSEWFAGIMDARAEDRLYDCLPMYHSIGGVVAVGALLVAGGSVIIRSGFSATRFWDDVVASEATIVQYIGELCRYLLAAPAGASAPRHRLRLCCGNGLRADVWTAFAERFDIPRIIEFYAATEGSFSLFNLEGRPGAVGRVPRFMAHRSPVALVRFDVDTEQPVRVGSGFCQRCDVEEPGEAIGRIASGDDGALATRFEGYTDETASSAKVLRDVFEPGDAWFRTGDLMRRDTEGFFHFVDRIGDTFRWKGENVSTTEVADALCACPGVVEASVHGVRVPHAEGRAGMAALVTDDRFDLAVLRAHAAAHLPAYARPLFLRLRGQLATTGTFKVQKSGDRREGFDPALITDPLFVDDRREGAFVTLDAARHAAIMDGRLRF